MSIFKSISPLFLLSACFSTNDSDPISTILFQIEDDSIDQHEYILELKPLETPKHVDILPEYKNEDSYL
ncbi:hypothetical protein SFC23_05765 [Shouchella clausii]|uniref:hypothetical protein n=1 Tax=Shouchella clausii TaxID=79880 RepID=UPI00398322D3